MTVYLLDRFRPTENRLMSVSQLRVLVSRQPVRCEGPVFIPSISSINSSNTERVSLCVYHLAYLLISTASGPRQERETRREKTIFCFESSRFLVSNPRKITREETDEMALLSGGNSTLNPNAPLYIPAAVRQVEDFSPEWYDLISTSTWYRDYWLSQRQEVTNFYNNKLDNLNSDDIVDMLPDDIDLGIEEEDFSYMNSRFDGFAQSYGHQGNKNMLTNDNGASKNPGMPRVSFPPGSRFAAQPGRVQGRAN